MSHGADSHHFTQTRDAMHKPNLWPVICTSIRYPHKGPEGDHKDVGFRELLKFKLTYQSIYIIEFLLNSTDPKSLVTCVGGKDRSFHIDQNAVHCVLGVPTQRGDDLPHYVDENTELNKLKSELGLTKDSKITDDLLRGDQERRHGWPNHPLFFPCIVQHPFSWYTVIHYWAPSCHDPLDRRAEDY